MRMQPIRRRTTVEPIDYGSTVYHEGRQWLVTGFDIRLRKIHIAADTTLKSVDAADVGLEWEVRD